MRLSRQTIARVSFALLVAAVLGAPALFLRAAPQSAPAAASTQRGFDTPEQAAEALVDAAGKYDVPALLEILGPASRDLVASEDSIEDRNRATAFAALARQRSSTVSDSTHRRAELIVGDENWPLPIPLVNRKGKWYFDTNAGRQQVLLRRIGENELNAIRICRGYVEAQREYAATKHDGSAVNEYAQRIISTPGKQDGLAWQTPDGTWDGPVGEAAARALDQGYSVQGQPYHGYYFKVLKGQGPAAPLGQLDFVVKGHMIGGFALAAAPARYRITGVQTFIVSHDGIVYQKDLGAETLNILQSMNLYNPDKTWRETDDEL